MTIDVEKFKIAYDKWVAESEPEFRPGNAKIFKNYPLIISEDIPWTLYQGKPSEQTFALVTSGGLYLKDSQSPFDIQSIHGDLSFREIPKDVQFADLGIAHAHYDHALAEQDINIIFPIQRFVELENEGIIGQVADMNYSFSYVNDAATLVTETIPKFLDKLKTQSVDALFLTPV
jgi:D-proline reductase (dithiol) PrdB